MSVSYLASNVGLMGKYRNDNMINSWGMIYDKCTQSYWIVNNGSNTLSVLDCKGRTVMNPITVVGNGPTDIVANISCGFNIRDVDDKCSKKLPALIIVVNEDGTISGYNPKVNDTTTIQLFSNNLMVFKGCTIGFERGIATLYVADFAGGSVIPFDQCMQPKPCFTDKALAKIGYSPFNVRVIEQQLYVAFAKRGQITESESPSGGLQITHLDDVSGIGNGFIDVFSLDGCLLRRLVNRGYLNSPWAMVYDCGYLYVANNGDGKIIRYDLAGKFLGTVKDHGDAVVLDGLWAILPVKQGFYFAAGMNSETIGAFGVINRCSE